MTTVGKVRKTLTLDADVVEALSADSDNLSATVNTLAREALASRRRRAALAEMVAELNDEAGGAPDPVEVDRFADRHWPR